MDSLLIAVLMFLMALLVLQKVMLIMLVQLCLFCFLLLLVVLLLSISGVVSLFLLQLILAIILAKPSIFFQNKLPQEVGAYTHLIYMPRLTGPNISVSLRRYNMGCYRPLIMYNVGYDEATDKFKYKFTGLRAERSDPRTTELGDVIIPCKKCIGCRLDYSRAWADRLMLELDHSKTAVFVTLTYDNEHAIPAMFDDNFNTWWYTLDKKHVQDFHKRLRYFFPDKRIRLFTCGEYGSRTLRPHYHSIYFGLSLDDFTDKKLFKLNEHMQPIYSSEWLDSVWSHGFTSIGSVSWQSCAYVARYALKKQKLGAIDALSRNCEPEFVLMSRRPGIAGYFAIDHPEIFDSPLDPIFIDDKYGVKSVNSVKMPKYLFEKLELINPRLYAKIKQEKIEASNARFLEELAHTDLSEFEYLDMKENKHNSVEKVLVRSGI